MTKDFTDADRIQDENLRKKQAQDLGLAIGISVGLILSAIVGVIAPVGGIIMPMEGAASAAIQGMAKLFSCTEKTFESSLGATSALANFVTSLYIGLQAHAKKWKDNV